MIASNSVEIEGVLWILVNFLESVFSLEIRLEKKLGLESDVKEFNVLIPL